MQIFKQINRFIFCIVLLSFLMPACTHAFPYAYRRLVLKKDGKIVKVVDLVSDDHSRNEADDFAHPNNYPSPIGPSEKALLETFKRMVSRKSEQAILFIGESNSALINDKPMVTSVTYDENANVISFVTEETLPHAIVMARILKDVYLQINRKIPLPRIPFIQKVYEYFLRMLPFPKKIKALEKKSVYMHGDTFRLFANQFIIGERVRGNDPVKGKVRSSNAKDLIDISNPIDHELISFRKKVDIQTYESVNKLWQEFKQNVRCHCSQANAKVKKDCFKDPTIKAFNFSDLAITAKAMDFEILMKILGADHKHIVLFAGGAHCRALLDFLSKHFNYTVTFEIGSDSWLDDDLHEEDDGSMESDENLLPASTWSHLESDPFVCK